MKISHSIVTRLNIRYLTEINLHSGANAHRSIYDNVAVFVDKILRRGNALSLTDTDYHISTITFWDIEYFEDFCKYIYFCFKPGFTQKLIRALQDINERDRSFFQKTLLQHPAAYQDAIDHPDDPYLHFIGKKLISLNRKHVLREVIRLDKENRQLLLQALRQQPLALSFSEQTPVTTISTDLSGRVYFTSMLRLIDGSVNNTKLHIQQQLTLAEIPFELFISKPVTKTSTGKNPDGFNGAVAAMITTFKELGYFKDELIFSELLDAYLKETGNSIGKLSSFKRNYLSDNYYQRYKQSLSDLSLKKYQ